MRKSGEIANQVFVYVMAAIIFSMVLLYGYKAIGSFIDHQKTIELINFKSQVESSISDISATQDRKEVEFIIPAKYELICFVDMTKGGKACITNSYCDLCSDKFCSDCPNNNYPAIVCDAWRDNVSQSIFMVPWSDIPFKTRRIEVLNETRANNGILCMSLNKGKLRLNMQGKGNRAQISPVET